jgi:hypothetical protein
VAKLIAILGSVTPPGRMLNALKETLESKSIGADLESDLINLADCRVAFADGRPPDELGDDTASIVARVDSPLPHLTTQGEQGSLDKFQQSGSGKTLRQLIYESSEFESSIELLGTPDSVADRMAEIIEETGGDGFLITTHNQATSLRQVLEVTEGLVPALQRRGLVRTEYKYPTLRQNLREF